MQPTESGLGVQTVLRNGVSGDYPFSFAETPGGLLLMANGVDPMLKWDGLAQTSATAGIVPPATAMELGGINLGPITGTRVAYQRFLDSDGNASDLSPVSNIVDFGTDGWIEDVNYSTSTGVVTVRSAGHGLSTGDAILIADVEGTELLDGSWNITVVDDATFTINHLVITGGLYTQGGTWATGVGSVIYGAVAVPAEGKVVRRQILRNLDGNLDVLYVDVDTTDLVSTAFASTADDEALAAGEPVPLTYGDDDLSYANSNAVPPSHKSVVCSHKGRIWAAVDASYSSGHAEVSFNSTAVQGVGTDWRSTFAGRLIYLDGAASPYSIASVNESTQVATLSAPYLDPPRPYQAYVIRPEVGERRLVYYSEPGRPESWPAYNATAVPEDDDEISGLLSLGQYLYVVERRHIYRFTCNAEIHDGIMFLVAQRGSLNDRTYAVTDSGTFFLDEIGIHKFDGDSSTPISQPIQSIFQSDGTGEIAIDWSADSTLWHAAHDPTRDLVRWFVTMTCSDSPDHAICYNYRADRWWIEKYPTAMTASDNVTFGARRSLCGTDARRIVCLSEGSLDGVDPGWTLRGTATSATNVSLTFSGASFDACEGSPLAIVDGTGVGQERIIAVATSDTLTVTKPWDVTPDATSVFQIGGIGWIWRSGWFQFFDDEYESPTDVEVVFRPIEVPGSFDVKLYFDNQCEPRCWSRTIDQDGVRTIDGSPRVFVDLMHGIGWARQRFTRHADIYSFGDKFVSVELSGFQAGEPVRISQVSVSGVEVS